MATEPQIVANRQNAQASTGPKTAEGKARSAANATSFGLFTKENCVQPEEREEYDNLYNALWLDLSPRGAMEELFATEIVRGAWRLRRCVAAEASLAGWVGYTCRQQHETKHGNDVPCPTPRDPSFLTYSQATQAGIDRARSQASGTVRRATADLRRLQNERLFRVATLPQDADAAQFGLASFQEIVPQITHAAIDQLLGVIAPPPADAVVPVGKQAPKQALAGSTREFTNRTRSVESILERQMEEIEDFFKSAA